MNRTKDPRCAEISPIRIAGDKWYDWRSPKEGDFSSAFDATVNGPSLARLLLTEKWQMDAEIVPNYVPAFGKPEDRPYCVARVRIHSTQPNTEEDSYSYLRYSKGPRQGFFWDIYGDDLQSFELAVLALSQAPAPHYCRPMVFNLALTFKETSQP